MNRQDEIEARVNGWRGKGEISGTLAMEAFDVLLARVRDLEAALREARPYVHGVATDSTLSGWRQETAQGILARLDASLAPAEKEPDA